MGVIIKLDEGRRVIDGVCERRGIPATTLLSKYRHVAAVDARREVAVELRDLGWSTTQIGYLLRRDHSTIVYLLKPDEERRRYLEAKKIRAARAIERAEGSAAA